EQVGIETHRSVIAGDLEADETVHVSPAQYRAKAVGRLHLKSSHVCPAGELFGECSGGSPSIRCVRQRVDEQLHRCVSSEVESICVRVEAGKWWSEQKAISVWLGQCPAPIAAGERFEASTVRSSRRLFDGGSERVGKVVVGVDDQLCQQLIP